ncbi:MAG: alkaline phosphatase family protein [Acidobacteriota bacterium]|jgi:hypothetical protein
MMRLSLIVALCCLATSLPAVPGVPAQQSHNVVLVTLDGVRWQEIFSGADEALLNEEAGGAEDPDALRAAYWRPGAVERRRALMPFLWDRLVPAGQIFGDAWEGSEMRVTNGRNFSYPGYQELLGGFPDDRIDSNDKVLNPNPNVLEWIASQPEFDDRVAAFTSWDTFPFILNEPRAGIPVNSGWESLDLPSTPRRQLLEDLIRTFRRDGDGVRDDELTFFAALEYLAARRPRVLYLSFDGTDTDAHSRRYDRYLGSAHMADEYLRMLWETLQSTEGYAGTTTLIVTTDHGRGDAPDEWRSHGEDVAGSQLVWLAAIGPGIEALGLRTDVPTLTQSQVAATVAALLGLDYPAAVPQAAAPIEALLR